MEAGAVRLAVTAGDLRGVGPDVVVGALARFREESPGVTVRLLAPEEVDPDATAPDTLFDPHLPPREAGRRAARALERAAALALAEEVDGIVTGPVHKPSLHAAGWTFPGQTEFLQDRTGVPAVGMLMAAERTRIGPPLRVLLATTHLPLRAVPDRITAPLLVEQTVLLSGELRRGWGIGDPVVGLCALNPHASDGGLFGDEEERVYGPALEELRGRGLDVRGPVPADTVFHRCLAGELDGVVAPYHDVGMAAFKTLAFGSGVNVTLGLPFVRTSPDHGTAFDRAGQGTADTTSTLEALRLAARLAARWSAGAGHAAP